uniref:Apple domain-containing protein n=1 Tax=Trichuris muris TaxID=70415 RepID=A0A5S6QT11_TRIMR
MKTTSRYTTAILLVALVGAAICNAETLSISMLDEKCIVERLEDVADISGKLIEKQRGVVSLELCVGYCKIPELRQRCNAVRYREEDGSCQLFRISETEYEDNYIEPDEGELYSVTSCQEEEIIVRLPGTNFNCTVNLVNHRKLPGKMRNRQI